MELKLGVFVCSRHDSEVGPPYFVVRYYDEEARGSSYLYLDLPDLPDLINLLQDVEAKEYNK